MTASTVPRPPAVEPLWAETEEIGAQYDLEATFAAVMVFILVAIPTAVAFLAGFTVRCAALVAGAAVEAYTAGRGRRG